MYSTRTRVAARSHYHYDDLAVIVAGLTSRWSNTIETLGLGILVCAFWGLVLFAAVAYGLR